VRSPSCEGTVPESELRWRISFFSAVRSPSCEGSEPESELPSKLPPRFRSVTRPSPSHVSRSTPCHFFSGSHGSPPPSQLSLFVQDSPPVDS